MSLEIIFLGLFLGVLQHKYGLMFYGSLLRVAWVLQAHQA